MRINPNLSVLKSDPEVVILRIGSKNGFVKMSAIEYEIIRCYSTSLDFNAVLEYFKSDIVIRVEQLELLIKKAYESKIFIDDDSTPKRESAVSLILKRKKKMFEVVNLDFTNTWFERCFESPKFSKILLLFLGAFFSYIVFDLFSEPLNFKENYMETLYLVPVSFSSIFGFIYLSALLSTIVHEIGHYFIYKKLGGKTSVFGIGFLFFFIPVFFNRILVGFIDKRADRIFINAGGMLFDFLQVLFFIYFTKTFHQTFPLLSFFCYSIMASIVMRTFFNLNIFLPGSDGYHIFTDLIKRPNLYQSAIDRAKDIFYKKEGVGCKNYVCAFYIGICYLFFTVSWCMIFLPIATYFFYAGFR